MGCGASGDGGAHGDERSVQRDELRRLPRSLLRKRLQELGAADTEGEGLFHGALADTVLLWNALDRLRADDKEQQEEAVRALRDSGLPASLLRRALLVLGTPFEESQSLSQAEVTALLHARLVQFTMLRVASGLIMRTESAVLRTIFHCWRAACGTQPAQDLRVAGVALRVVEEEDEGAVAFCAPELPALAEPEPVLPVQPVCEAEATEASVAPAPAFCSTDSRDAKFEALSADLLDSVDEAPDSLAERMRSGPAAGDAPRVARPLNDAIDSFVGGRSSRTPRSSRSSRTPRLDAQSALATESLVGTGRRE